MAMSTLTDKERQELSQLLPWYANGTLDSDNSRRIEAALASDDALAREFDLVLEDQAAVIEMVSEEEVPLSMPERFKAALTAEMSRPAPSAKPKDTDGSVIGRIVSSLFPARPRAYAAIAAVIALLVPAVVILSSFNTDRQTGQYQTASGDEETATAKARMLVKFAPDVSWAAIDAFLKDNRGQIVGGPTGDGLYELEFARSEDLADRMAAKTDLFEFALPAN